MLAKVGKGVYGVAYGSIERVGVEQGVAARFAARGVGKDVEHGFVAADDRIVAVFVGDGGDECAKECASNVGCHSSILVDAECLFY